MRCKWCSNPEGMKINAPIIVSNEAIPDIYCANGAIVDGKIERSVCKTCSDFDCLKEKNSKIYTKAISMSENDVIEDILNSKMMFFNGGGVTFTGGEVLLQSTEVLNIVKKLKKEGINTAIETNGSLPVLQDLLPFVDYLMMDLKHYDDSSHTYFTGISLKPILENLKSIVASGRQILLRIPLINGVNTDNVDGFIHILDPLKKENLHVELLRYHEYGKEKWAMCGYEYTMKDGHITEQVYNKFLHRFKESGFTVLHT